jgi:hypothetical protein
MTWKEAFELTSDEADFVLSLIGDRRQKESDLIRRAMRS